MLEKENTKGSMVGHRWSLPAERVCFCSLGAFETYNNLWEGENKVIPM
jgi:hypothetical protein